MARERGADTTANEDGSPRSEPAGPGDAETGGMHQLSEAIESGAGLPAVARAAAAALDANVALIDRSSAVLAVAAVSGAEERKLLDLGAGVDAVELRVADSVVGELRYRTRGEESGGAPLRMVATLLALEVERARSPGWASDEAADEFVAAVLDRRLADPEEIVARASELGTDLGQGGGVIWLRARPRAAQPGEWRERVLMLTLRAVRAGAGAALAASSQPEAGEAGEVAALVPTAATEQLERAATEVQTELDSSLQGFEVAVGHSRHVPEAGELYRAGKEALLALNVSEAEGSSPLAFERTGSYRLLLPALSEDPAELESFYAETIAPLAAYDDQYETELVATVEAYLANDGNVTPTAETLFTHRHTIRYRLERIRELCGHDLTSTEGREKLGLGLKSMRVLGIPAPHGPALEAGGKAGKAKQDKG